MTHGVRIRRTELKPAQQKVLATLGGEDLPELSREQYERIAGVSRSQAAYDLAELVEAGILVRVGAGRSTRYRPARSDDGETREPAEERPRRRWTEERIRAELAEFCSGRTSWPSASDFKRAGRGDLYVAASRYGGIGSWAAELGFAAPARAERPAERPEPPVERVEPAVERPEPPVARVERPVERPGRPVERPGRPAAGPVPPTPRRRIALPLVLVVLAGILVTGTVAGLRVWEGTQESGEAPRAVKPPREEHSPPARRSPRRSRDERPRAKGHSPLSRPQPTFLLRASRGSSWLSARARSAAGKVLYQGVLARGAKLRLQAEAVWIRPAAPRNLDAILGARQGRPLPRRAAAVLVTRKGIRVLSRRPGRRPSRSGAETSGGPAPSAGSSTEPAAPRASTSAPAPSEEAPSPPLPPPPPSPPASEPTGNDSAPAGSDGPEPLPAPARSHGPGPLPAPG